MMGDLSDHFSRSEFACKCGCGFDTVDYRLILVLEALHNHYGNKRAITITSGCRCDEHNSNIKGHKNSYHKKSKASDIVVAGINPANVYHVLDSRYPNKYGLGKYNSFTHIDVRSAKARWSG